MTIDTRSQKDNPSISVIIEIISLENILQLLIESDSIYEGERKKNLFLSKTQLMNSICLLINLTLFEK